MCRVGQYLSLTLCLLIFWQQSISLNAQTTKTITDKFGNSADQDSKITYVGYNETVKYETKSGPTFDAGLKAFYKMARSIARSGFGFSYPYDMVVDLKTEGPSLRALFAGGEGYVIGLIAGLIFFIVFFLLAFCMPCCLCCSACCNRKSRKRPPTTTKVAIHGVTIVVLVGIFALVGLCASYQTISHSTPAIASFLKSIADAVSDVETFINFSVNELLFIFDKLDFTKKVFFRDLDNIGQLMGNIIRKELLSSTKLGTSITDLKHYEITMQIFQAEMDNLQRNLLYLNQNTTAANSTLHTFLTSSTCASSNCPPLSIPSIPQVNLSGPQAKLKALRSMNLSGNVDKGKSEVDKIALKTANYSRNQVDGLKKNLDDQLKAFNGFRNVLTDVKQKVLQQIDTDRIANEVNDFRERFQNVDSTRTTVMKGLVSFDLLAMLLLLLGSVLLVMVYRNNFQSILRTGGEKDCQIQSSTGGKLMYAGVGIFIIFSGIWMLYALILFAVGAPLDAIFCAIIEDPDFTILDNLIEKRDLLGSHDGGTWLATVALNISGSTITVGSVLRDCRDEKTLFKAVQMDKHPMANFSKLVDFKNKLRITDLLENVNFNLSNVNLLNRDVRLYLRELSALPNAIPFQALEVVIKQANASGTDLRTYPTRLQIAAQSQYPASLVNNQLNKIATAIADSVAVLKSTSQDLKTKINGSITAAEKAQQQIPGLMKSAIKKGAKEFGARIDLIVEAFIQEAKKNVYFDYAKCKPVYNILVVLLRDDMCVNLANILNGSWLAMGWLQLFLLVASIRSVALNRMIPLPHNPFGPDDDEPVGKKVAGKQTSSKKINEPHVPEEPKDDPQNKEPDDVPEEPNDDQQNKEPDDVPEEPNDDQQNKEPDDVPEEPNDDQQNKPESDERGNDTKKSRNDSVESVV